MTDIPATYWNTRDRIVGPATREEFHTIGQQETRGPLEDFIIAHGRDVADIGCNTGVEGVRLFEKGFKGRYTGVDSNPKALECAAQNLAEWTGRVSLCYADIHCIPLEKNQFDLAFTRGVLEHLSYYDQALREVGRPAGASGSPAVQQRSGRRC